MENSSSSSSGIGFLGLLQVVLIALKLTGFVSISWWLVLIPLWINIIVIVIIIVIAIVYVIVK